jgi:hypothetical protein
MVNRTRTLGAVCLGVGTMLFLTALVTMPADAAEGNLPILQPSPRPPWFATLTPAATPSPEAASGPPPVSAEATPTPTPALIPHTGGSPRGGWLLEVGISLIVLGLALTGLAESKAQTDPHVNPQSRGPYQAPRRGDEYRANRHPW